MTATILNFPLMVKTLDNPHNRIREWRSIRNMSQGRLAEIIGVNQNAISRIEKDGRTAPLYRLRLIAEALNVDVGQLLAPADNTMGLDEAGLQLMGRVQDDPRLGPALIRVAETLQSYDAGAATPLAASNDDVPPVRKRRHD